MLNAPDSDDGSPGSASSAAPTRTVVLLNPFPFDRRIWAENVPALRAAGWRVVTSDYPGFSADAPGTGDFSIDGIADRLALELRERRLHRVTLLGLSMGGYVALSLAARFPEVVAALILADTRAAADSPGARAGRESALATLAHPTGGVDAYLAASLPRLLAPQASSETLARVRALALDRVEPLRAGIEALRDRPDRSAALAALRVPTLVLVGDRDGVVPPAEMRSMAGLIDGSVFAQVPDAGHLSNFEQPERFNRSVLEFMAALA